MSKRWKKTRPSRKTPSVIQAAVAVLPDALRICGASEALELEAQSANGDGKPRLRKFSMTAYTGVEMNLQGFIYPLVVDLEGMRVLTQRQPILRNHDHDLIVGHTESVEKSAQRLRVVGVMSGVGEAAQEVQDLAANDFPWQASIGASIERLEFVDAGEKVTVNRRSFQGPLYVARETSLREISFVPAGADGSTSATIAAQNRNQNREEATMNEFDKWLQARGFDSTVLTDVQKAALKAAYQAEQQPPSAPAVVPPPSAATPPPSNVNGANHTKTMDEIVAAARADQERRNRITEIVAEVITSQPEMIEVAEALGRQALEGNWKVERLELELLRARRPNAPNIVIPQQSQITDEVIEAAVCMAGRLGNIEKHYDSRTLEAAHRKWRHGLGLGELILTAAHRRGFRGVNLKANLKEALTAAFSPMEIRAGLTGPSTYSLPNILSNVANKFLAMGFNAVDNSWRMIASIRSVSDFKQVTSFSLTGALQYEKVAPGGELKHGTLGETVYTNQADTYGIMIGLDRRDLINDDTGALGGVSARLGRGAGLKLADIFWTEFLNNSSFFTAGNNNVITGGTSVLSGATGLEALRLADEKFRNQTDPDGKPLGIFPAILLVPTALRISALNLMNSTTVVGTTTANSMMPDQNAFAGAYQVVSSPYLSNSSYTGFSTTAWYLLANPNELSTIEVCFLNGVETPTVETADMDFNTLGVAMRAFHDAGVNLQEFRAGVRAAGA